LDQKHLSTLEKILPVINGLLYLTKENRQKVMADGFFLKALFDVFKCQIPIEFLENALYACLNVLQDATKQLKSQLYDLSLVNPLLKFV